MNEPPGLLPDPGRHRHDRDPVPRRGTGPDPVAPEISTRRPFGGFDREQATYEKARPDLLSRAEGQYVVVVGDAIAGPVDTFHEAMRLGYAEFGLGPLYIKQIFAEEPASEATRDVDPCRP